MFVFENPSWWLTLLMLAVMLSFAMYNAVKRVKVEMSKELKRLVCLSMAAGYTVTAAVFLFVVLRINPWFDPQYCIPISGMIVGNSMTGIAPSQTSRAAGCGSGASWWKTPSCWGPPGGGGPGRGQRRLRQRHPAHHEQYADHGHVFLPGMMTGRFSPAPFPSRPPNTKSASCWRFWAARR